MATNGEKGYLYSNIYIIAPPNFSPSLYSNYLPWMQISAVMFTQGITNDCNYKHILRISESGITRWVLIWTFVAFQYVDSKAFLIQEWVVLFQRWWVAQDDKVSSRKYLTCVTHHTGHISWSYFTNTSVACDNTTKSMNLLC